MKNIFILILCASTICYSADNVNNKPNHIIGVASIKDAHYVATRGFIDEGKTYACALAYTPDSSLDREILQYISHEILKKQTTGKITFKDLREIASSQKCNFPQEYTLNLVSLIVVNQKSIHKTGIQTKRWQTGYGISSSDRGTWDLTNTPYQLFEISSAFLLPMESSVGLGVSNNSDDIAQHIASNTQDLNADLVVTVRTMQKNQLNKCTIS